MSICGADRESGGTHLGCIEKMTELYPKIKDALLKINFVERYEKLSARFSAAKTLSDDRLIYLDGEKVMAMIRAAGYSPQFDTREKFYRIKEEHIGKYSFNIHIILRYGIAELVWVVKEDGVLLLGAPWSTYSRRLIDGNYRIKNPVFGTYADLEEILKIVFEMYEDFKRALM